MGNITMTKWWRHKWFKPYSVTQRIDKVQSLQALSIPIDTAGEPRAKRERASVNIIQPIPHRKFSVIYHQTHTQTSPTGREASQLQQVIHLKYHFLVTIKPRGFKIQKILPEQLAGAEILPEATVLMMARQTNKHACDRSQTRKSILKTWNGPIKAPSQK